MDGIFVRVRSLLAVDKQLEFEGEEREGYSMAIGLNRDFFSPGLEHGITKRIKCSFGFDYGKSFGDL